MTDRPSDGSIERLKKRLYSRDMDITPPPRVPLSPHAPDAPERWGSEGPRTDIKPALGGTRRSFSYLKLALIAAVLFFVGSVAVAGYVLFGGRNVVSSEHVAITLNGPTTVGGGEELSLAVVIQNDNAAPLELADLLVAYPDGTRSPDDVTVALPRYRESLGTIPSGADVKRTLRAILFGEPGVPQNIHLELEYRVAGSNAIFVKQADYAVTIGSSPLSVTVESVDELTSGQETTLSVTVASNATTPIEGAMLRVEYPFGFTFTSATPAPTYGNATWNLGVLSPREKQTIRITGKLEGQDNEERVFRYSAGVANPRDPRALGTAFLTATDSIVMKRPFIGIDLALDGERGKATTARLGELIRGDVSWVNNLEAPVLNLSIEAKITGAALNKKSVAVSRGFYRSSDSTIVWSKDSDGALATVAAGAEGVESFTFAPLSLSEGGGSLRNPKIIIEISVKGERVGEDGVPESVSSFVSREVTVASNLILSGKALYGSGPFQNSGSLPPKVEKETTYTIVWSLANATNVLQNVKVTATLPPYLRWLGNISPSTETMSYSEVGGTVTWNAGDLKAGVGFGSPAREVAFQVALVPSTSQQGSAPPLIGQATATGDDSFTGASVSDTAAALTTRLDDDPTFKNGQEFVTQ